MCCWLHQNQAGLRHCGTGARLPPCSFANFAAILWPVFELHSIIISLGKYIVLQIVLCGNTVSIVHVYFYCFSLPVPLSWLVVEQKSRLYDVRTPLCVGHSCTEQ